jgi:hypothetical protein
MRKGAFQEAEGCGKISRALVGAGGMNRLHRPFLKTIPRPTGITKKSANKKSRGNCREM